MSTNDVPLDLEPMRREQFMAAPLSRNSCPESLA